MPYEAPTTAEAKSSPKFWQHPTFIAIAVAVLTFLGSFLGGLVAGNATEQAAEIEVNAEAQKEERQKRSDVYTAYLTAANDYNLATVNFRESLNEPSTSYSDIEAPSEPISKYDVDAKDFQAARSAYQASVNEVYIYGSDAGWAAHVFVSQQLPPSLGVITNGEVVAGDPEEFAKAHRKFTDVFCAEGAVEPRAGCGKS